MRRGRLPLAPGGRLPTPHLQEERRKDRASGRGRSIPRGPRTGPGSQRPATGTQGTAFAGLACVFSGCSGATCPQQPMALSLGPGADSGDSHLHFCWPLEQLSLCPSPSRPLPQCWLPRAGLGSPGPPRVTGAVTATKSATGQLRSPEATQQEVWPSPCPCPATGHRALAVPPAKP